MDFRIDKFVWIFACTFCTIITVLFFVPALSNFYFSLGRYIIYFAFFISLAAVVLTWHRAYRLKGWRNYAMATIKTLVLAVIVFITVAIIIVSHSGI